MTKYPSLLYGIGVAGALSVLSLCFGAVLTLIFFGALGINVLIGSLALLYIFNVLRTSRVKTGQSFLGLLSIGVLGLGALLFPPGLYLLFSVAMLWLMRSLYSYSSLISALLDSMLCVLSLGAGLWGYAASGSIAAAVWCFFLLQALYVLIPHGGFGVESLNSESTDFECPPRSNRQQKASDQRAIARFVRAHSAAEEALRQMI
jgi:hypothetical protein